MPKTVSGRYRVARATSKCDHTPRAGLLAVSRAFRGLGLARLVDEYRAAQLEKIKKGGIAPSHLVGSSDILEFLILSQIAGADCVQDMQTLNADGCLVEALGGKGPGIGQVHKCLRAIGQTCRAVAPGADPWQALLAESVAKIRNKIDQEEGGGLHHATIDVEVVPELSTARLAWQSNAPPPAFPARTVCLWREANLVLAGGMCRHAADLVAQLTAAMNAIDRFGIARLLRAGPECWEPAVQDWIRERIFTYRTKPDGQQWKTYQRSIRYILCLPPTAISVQGLPRESKSVWHSDGFRGGDGITWTVSRKQPGGDLLRELTLRKKHVGGEGYEYARLETNVERTETHLLQQFLKGGFAVACAIREIAQLAQGAFPADTAGDAGEGRFRLALLAYNVFTAIRQLGLSGAESQMGLDRFRLKYLCGVGRMSTEGRGRWLNLSQEDNAKFTNKIWRCYPS